MIAAGHRLCSEAPYKTFSAHLSPPQRVGAATVSKDSLACFSRQCVEMIRVLVWASGTRTGARETTRDCDKERDGIRDGGLFGRSSRGYRGLGGDVRALRPPPPPPPPHGSPRAPRTQPSRAPLPGQPIEEETKAAVKAKLIASIVTSARPAQRRRRRMVGNIASAECVDRASRSGRQERQEERCSRVCYASPWVGDSHCTLRLMRAQANSSSSLWPTPTHE